VQGFYAGKLQTLNDIVFYLNQDQFQTIPNRALNMQEKSLHTIQFLFKQSITQPIFQAIAIGK